MFSVFTEANLIVGALELATPHMIGCVPRFGHISV